MIFRTKSLSPTMAIRRVFHGIGWVELFVGEIQLRLRLLVAYAPVSLLQSILAVRKQFKVALNRDNSLHFGRYWT